MTEGPLRRGVDEALDLARTSLSLLEDRYHADELEGAPNEELAPIEELVAAYAVLIRHLREYTESERLRKPMPQRLAEHLEAFGRTAAAQAAVVERIGLHPTSAEAAALADQARAAAQRTATDL